VKENCIHRPQDSTVKTQQPTCDSPWHSQHPTTTYLNYNKHLKEKHTDQNLCSIIVR